MAKITNGAELQKLHEELKAKRLVELRRDAYEKSKDEENER